MFAVQISGITVKCLAFGPSMLTNATRFFVTYSIV